VTRDIFRLQESLAIGFRWSRWFWRIWEGSELGSIRVAVYHSATWLPLSFYGLSSVLLDVVLFTIADYSGKRRNVRFQVRGEEALSRSASFVFPYDS